MARAALRRGLSWRSAGPSSRCRRGDRPTPSRPRARRCPTGPVTGRASTSTYASPPPDGYTAQRSYSIASAPEARHVELIVDRLPDGEVSPYLTDELRVGDELEVRGPFGGWFVWQVAIGSARSS